MQKRDIRTFHQQLHRWYAAHGRRDLPWRNTSDPYAIYLSEVMLQQTQVKTVLERYYFPFLQRFPTLAALAEAPQEAVLSAWQGLGYYSRALNLHKAAKASGGQLPADVEALRALPGVGQNTAHAVAAFAFRMPHAVMEANVKRVLCRIFALENPGAAELWERAAQLLDADEPFDYNQAMMDVGAMVCTKRAPRCGECPSASICQGKSAPEHYPAKKQAKAVPVRQKTIWVLRNAAGQVYATPRQTAFLRGLYHFSEEENGAGNAFSGGVRLGEIRQQYSHFTLEAQVMLAEGHSGQGEGWHGANALRSLPMSIAEHKILDLLVKYDAAATATPKVKPLKKRV